MQGGSPRVEYRAAIRVIYFLNEVVHALEAAGDVVVVLDSDGDANVRRAPRTLAQGFDRDLPLCLRRCARALVSGEHADQIAVQRSRNLRQLLDVPDLDLTVRDVAMLQVRREVGIPGDAGHAHAMLLQARMQPGLEVRTPIQHRKVRTLRHQHDSVVTEAGRFTNELFQRQKLLPPRTRITDGVEYKALDHIFHCRVC